MSMKPVTNNKKNVYFYIKMFKNMKGQKNIESKGKEQNKNKKRKDKGLSVHF